ncbi:MAG TPA: Uma2 family endonuclease [Pirellulales bacterium]|nr:Uma2 family endonuclease [Pirellulales bacterium]
MAIVTEQHVPPLEMGDKLTRDEFLRRWEADLSVKFAELIGGVVYMPSPVSGDHGKMDRRVSTWLGVYQAATPGVDGANNATSIMLDDAPQPDLSLLILPEYGGGSRTEGRYFHGALEFVAEVCASGASYDLNQKYDLYEAAGIPEYLAVLLFEQEIRWHLLVDGRYQILSPDDDGLLRSRVFPGLWLDGPALLAGNLRQVLDRLQDGLRSPDHERFVAQLAERRKA